MAMRRAVARSGEWAQHFSNASCVMLMVNREKKLGGLAQGPLDPRSLHALHGLQGRLLKLAFHDAATDTDTDIDILARIVARTSACRSARHRNKKHLKNVGPIRHCEPPTPIHQVSRLSHAACASMSTTTTTTTTTTIMRDRGDRYGPIE